MQLEDIIKPDAVLCNARARSKKHCLEILSELLVRSHPDIAAEDIFESLIERERLGCTGLEKGVAFPHCRVDGLDACAAALIKLADPVDFDSTDAIPVDLVFGLMVPVRLDDSHYAVIDELSALLKDAGLRGRLRSAATSSDLYEALLHGSNINSPRKMKAAQGR